MLATVITKNKRALINILRLWRVKKYQWEIMTTNK